MEIWNCHQCINNYHELVFKCENVAFLALNINTLMYFHVLHSIIFISTEKVHCQRIINSAHSLMLPTNTFQYQSQAQSREFNCGTHCAQRQCYIIERESLHTNSLKISTITKKMWWTGRSNFIYFLIEQSN